MNKLDNMEKQTFNEKEAACYLGVSISFLQKDRSNGYLVGRTIGPPWIKIGRRVLYTKQDLEQYLAKRTVYRT